MTNTIRYHCAALASDVDYLLACIRDNSSDSCALQECADHMTAARAALGEPMGEGPPAVTISALLYPAYEPGDSNADGAQLVGLAWWRPVMGCDSLQMVVDNARGILGNRWGRPVAPPAPEAPAETLAARTVAAVEICHAHKDGECHWAQCPQLRDGEPAGTCRSCPLPLDPDDIERAALAAAPPPQQRRSGRVIKELDELTERHISDLGDLRIGVAPENVPAMVSEALARWGRPAAPPALKPGEGGGDLRSEEVRQRDHESCRSIGNCPDSGICWMDELPCSHYENLSTLPAPETPAETLAARPLLEKVAGLGDVIGRQTVAQVQQLAEQAAAWLEQNPPGHPIALEPRGCPTPGACSCVEHALPAPLEGEVGELSAKEVEAQNAFTQMRDEILNLPDGVEVNEVLGIIDNHTPEWV